MIKIAVMGYGTVGSGVAQVIGENPQGIADAAGEEISVKYILDVRDFPGDPMESAIIHDFSIIEQDPEIKIVAETIGGQGVAYEFTRRAMLAGKSVVTSNKELVAERGSELIALAAERGVSYMFEASVGGGIPIIRPLGQCLAANRIDEIFGILNGTTNYILTQMRESRADFEDVLKEAQALGYAELNPTADVDGFDAGRKVCILADLAFGREVKPSQVWMQGVRNIARADIAYADSFGYKIKLLGRIKRAEEGGIYAWVAPHLVKRDNILSSVDGVMNAITVRGSAVGEVMFYGPGAGKMATASAVVGDIIDQTRHLAAPRHLSWAPAEEGYVGRAAHIPSPWYVRVAAVPEDVLVAFPGAEPLYGASGECAFISAPLSRTDVEKACAGMKVINLFRVLD